jgi:uncharacterized protein (TIGR03435 family)
MRRWGLAAVFWVGCTGVWAQQTGFAVATIKPSPEGSPTMTQFQGTRFVTRGTTFVDLFKYAYSVHPDQVIGGPEWLRTERFDVVADPETEKRPSSDEMKARVQQLLVERFHVIMHKEKKVLSVYALQKAGAVKLKKSEGNEAGMPVVGFEPRGALHVGNATMAEFAVFLQRFALDRPAVDQTGIAGKYDVELRWTPENFHVNGRVIEPPEDGSAPELYTAIRDQLGLKLQATKEPTDVFVVDAAEKPAVD